MISIGIGGLVYLFFIRRALRNAEGEYVNAWPEWLDLEELLYRPLMLSYFSCSAKSPFLSTKTATNSFVI